MPTVFSEADYAEWNDTTSVVTIPQRIVGQDKSAVLRDAIIIAIGANNLKGCQVLPRYQVRVQFKTGRLRRTFDMRGLSFRGVHLTPEPAYVSRQQIFVEGAPFQFPNVLFSEALAGYGKVSQVKHLPVKGHPHIQSGTRMVTMSVSKDIPVFVTIAGFRCKVWYRGQPITCFGCGKTGHVISACPNRARPHSYAAAVNSAQVSAQHSEPPSSAAEDPSVDVSPSNNEATTNPASLSNTADKQHPNNAAPGRKSKAKKSKSGSSKAKDTTPPPTSQGDKASPPSWPERSVLENAGGGSV